MTAHEFLKSLPYLPYDKENMKERPSNSCLYRWLDRGSVIINDVTPKPHDEIEFPLKNLIFFPKGKMVTMW